VNGIVAVTNIDTVMDVQELIKYWQGYGNPKDSEEKLKLLKGSNAWKITYDGIIGRMEEAGLVAIFGWPVESHSI
jgi:hypothetical protein